MARAVARALAVAGAVLVLAGFFLPWIHGSAEFASRDFTGADLARLLRNFEIVASSSQEAGKFRLTAVVIYLVPALAVNGAVLVWLPRSRWITGVALLGAAAYAAFVLSAVVVLSAVSWTELQRVLGGPVMGFGCSLAGVVTLAAAGVLLVRQAEPAFGSPPAPSAGG